jgi:hypothetical protein
VGTALVGAVVRRCREYGLRRVVLATRDAHGIYRPFGFTDPPAGLLMELTRPPEELYGG